MHLYWIETPAEYAIVCCNRFDLADHCEDLGATAAYQLGLASPWCQVGMVTSLPASWPLDGAFLELLHRGRLEWSAEA